MWTSTVGLINGKHRYLTAETFGFKINSNGQQLKRRQQWTIEPFPENLGPDGSISSAASVTSQFSSSPNQHQTAPTNSHQIDPNGTCILTHSPVPIGSSSVRSLSNGSSRGSDQDACDEEHENVAIKSHLNKYLAVDSFGNVTCDSEEKTEAARFTITICSMSQGRSKDEHIFWAFKNVERGYYLGTSDDGTICCNAKIPRSRAELWHLHLIPARGASFFGLKSLGRKRFARVAKNETTASVAATAEQRHDQFDQVQLNATISWGPETLFQFKYYEGGKYSILTSDNMYLTNEGKCIDWKPVEETSVPPPECLFTLEYHSGSLAFRDVNAHYLAAAGRSSVLRSHSLGVSRDELFVFECAPIQVAMKATFNNRWVSIKQGVDLSANQTEITDKFETFQMTYHKQTQCWSVMTQDCNFWTVSRNTSTISVCRPGDYDGLTRGQFKLVWSDTDASFSLKFVDFNNKQERWITARKSGQLFLGSSAQEPVRFVMQFQNRRFLHLRPVDGSGFVGLKGFNNKLLEANKTAPDSIAIEYSELPESVSSGEAASMSASEPLPADCRPINVFNVKLNVTKMGQNVFENGNSKSAHSPTAKEHPQIIGEQEELINRAAYFKQQEIEFGLDDNNNNCTEVDNKYDNNESVESSSGPSVASIISSFSNTKISKQPTVENVQPNCVKTQASQLGYSVSRLTSSFESSGPQQQQPHDNRSFDTQDSEESVTTLSPNGSIQQTDDANCQQNVKSSLSKQIEQSECCYMKILATNQYLVLGDSSGSSIVCEATNRACAQAWILELRSHNSIAIRASDNHAYMKLGANGTIFLARCEPSEASLWEF